MIDELKPCPFQGDGEEHDVRFVELKPGYGQIGCSDCRFWFPSEEVVAKDEAVRRWNTRFERTCRMSHVLLYDEEGIEGIECDECGWSDIHPWDESTPERCPGCDAKVVG